MNARAWRTSIALGFVAMTSCRSATDDGHVPAAVARAKITEVSSSPLIGPATSDENKGLASGQQQVLVMYESMANVLGAAGATTDCDVLARSLEVIAERHSSDLKRWSSLLGSLSQSERDAAEASFEASTGTRMKTAQESIRTGLGRCASHQRFMDIFYKLASLTAAK